MEHSHDSPEDTRSIIEFSWEGFGIGGLGDSCERPRRNPADWDSTLQRIAIQGKTFQLRQALMPAPSCRQRPADAIARQI